MRDNNLKQLALHETEQNDDRMAEQNVIDQLIHSRLYLDRGKGFSESESICIKIQLRDGIFEEKLQVQNPQEIRGIRFELIEDSPCVCEIYMNVCNQKLRFMAENRTDVYQKMDLFLCKNPKYLIEIGMPFDGNIVLNGKCIYLNKNEISQFVNKLGERYEKREQYSTLLENEIIRISKEKEELDQQNLCLKEKIVEISKEKEELEQQTKCLEEEITRLSDMENQAESSLNQLQEQLLQIETSRGWKALNKLRKIKNMIRR